jgi:hypothetical protein
VSGDGSDDLDDTDELEIDEPTLEEALREYSDFPADEASVDDATELELPGGSDEASDVDRPRRRRGLLVLIPAVLIAGAVAVGLFVWPGDEEGDIADDASVTTIAELAEDDGSASGDSAPAEVAAPDDGSVLDSVAVDSGPDVTLAPPLNLPSLGLFDSLARPDSDALGVADSGQAWIEDAGDWGVESASAVIAAPNPSGPSLAVANTRTTRGTVQVTMPSVEPATGIVFRYENAFNYWALTAAPEAGTWSISQLVAGELTQVGSVGLAPTADFTTVAVRFDENLLEFFIDGTSVSAIIDPDTIGGTYAGLIGRGPDAVDARWTNFVVIAQASPLENL